MKIKPVIGGYEIDLSQEEFIEQAVKQGWIRKTNTETNQIALFSPVTKPQSQECSLEGDSELWNLIDNYFPAFGGEEVAQNKRSLFEQLSKLIKLRCGKPIPEKKEREHEFITGNGLGNIPQSICAKCGEIKLAPQKKIEELDIVEINGHTGRLIVDKINELIRWCNQAS